MAKETKQDRIVRGIFDQVTEHLHDLKSIEANLNAKETDVERWSQSFLKNCLGYTARVTTRNRSGVIKNLLPINLLTL